MFLAHILLRSRRSLVPCELFPQHQAGLPTWRLQTVWKRFPPRLRPGRGAGSGRNGCWMDPLSLRARVVSFLTQRSRWNLWELKLYLVTEIVGINCARMKWCEIMWYEQRRVGNTQHPSSSNGQTEMQTRTWASDKLSLYEDYKLYKNFLKT